MGSGSTAPASRRPRADGGRRPGQSRARLVWAILAFLLSAAALSVELGSHLCAGFYFDPLPDGISTVAYFFLAGMLLFNEYALGNFAPRRRADGVTGGLSLAEQRLVSLARVWSAAALTIAVAYTVMFLPILPISVMGLLFMGAGACAWSPLLNLLVLVAQSRALAARQREGGAAPPARLRAASRVCAAATAALLVGRPMAIGYLLQQALQSRADRERSVGWLRCLHAGPEVLNLCYRRDSSGWVWVSAGRWLASNAQPGDVIQEARQVYYLMTGRPFETEDADRIIGRTRGWIERDLATEQQGGELVGTAVHGLSLSASRLDGVLDPQSETARCEWTLVFKNETASGEEARAEILLPEGGVVDKASLWINGEERPAAFGATATAREAYQEVAIVRSRDPLLVTARDPRRVMVQCFPVPAGGRMQIRLGITAPLIWRAGGDSPAPRLTFAPPAFQQVNFRLPGELRHPLRMEGKWPASRGRLTGREWHVTERPAPGGAAPDEQIHTAHLELPAAEILDPPTLSVVGGTAPRPGDRLSPEMVRRDSPFGHATRPVDLLVLVDTTGEMRDPLAPANRQRLTTALAALPNGSRVRFVDVRGASLAPGSGATGWLPTGNAAEAERWWSGRRYVGGVDPLPALAWAWQQAAARPNPAAILWLHGGTPVDLGGASALTQRYDRRPDGPALIGVQCRPGPDAVLDELAGHRRVFALTARRDVDSLGDAVRLAASVAPLPASAPAADTGAAVPLGGRAPAINGVFAAPALSGGDGSAAGARHSSGSRLAAYSRVMSAWYDGPRAGRRLKAAQKLAIARRLVTPLSGAVVLETREQYERYQLDGSPSKSSIPSVPEPPTPAMLAVGAAMAGLAALYRRCFALRGA